MDVQFTVQVRGPTLLEDLHIHQQHRTSNLDWTEYQHHVAPPAGQTSLPQVLQITDKLRAIIMAATAMIAFFSVSVSCIWYGSNSDDKCI